MWRDHSFIHSFLRGVNIFAVCIMCKGYYALWGAGRKCAFSPTRVSSDMRETEQSKVKMNKCSIGPYDKYHEAQVSIVLKNSLGLSGGWGSRRWETTCVESWGMVSLRRLKKEKLPATQRAFQSEGIACAEDMKVERAWHVWEPWRIPRWPEDEQEEEEPKIK